MSSSYPAETPLGIIVPSCQAFASEEVSITLPCIRPHPNPTLQKKFNASLQRLSSKSTPLLHPAPF